MRAAQSSIVEVNFRVFSRSKKALVDVFESVLLTCVLTALKKGRHALNNLAK